ncbi:hypothetical protein [Marinobacter xiaoshiensis]|uniref:Uncharacterized protein n=1 Tax=Marinobacter xiaoshiensis TaxID=3073652 RepID=A0ABU2HIU4_9GAMM|nr:hypothetical protein [Marinobacter sp. F60267]MDS1310501.1 hypothetical protein [Marinobacter sp. F60267]
MTSEEFRDRFQHHPLGHVLQNMEIAETEIALERYLGMALGMVMVMCHHEHITKEEQEFLMEASKGNAKRNYDRVMKTNAAAPATRQ